ncbi:MAG: sulfatase-like hydrolase/transferase, partial [candidate division Zixibacteria bacterium]|nr:sulfatase-like hydrolase/transferase [candidate division Zixibacteria bacterium]
MATRKSENIFIHSIVGGIICAVVVGLIESIILTLHFNWQDWNLPFTGLLYYGLIGLIIGAAVGIALMFTKRFLNVGFNGGFGFILAGGGAIAFCTYHYIALLLEDWGLGTSIPVKAVGYSILLVTAILLVTLLYHIAFKSFLKKYDRALSYLAICYFVLLAGAFIIFKTETGWGYEHIPYEINEYAEQPDPKYVFLIILDATRFDWLSTEGYDIETPNIQSIADDGIYFPNAIANSYWTKPTMASIFTGVYPKVHGTLRYETPLPRNIPVLAGQFTDLGYYTIGITTNVNLKHDQRYSRGFNNYTFMDRDDFLPFDERVPDLNRVLFLRSIIKRIPQIDLYGVRPMYTSGLKTTKRTIELIEFYNNAPLFVYLHYMDPHDPYYEHPYNGKYRHPKVEFTPEDSLERVSDLYVDELEYTDRRLGELFDYMKRANIYDSALIFLTADHGEEFFDHYAWNHMFSLYEELIHVPLIIKPPETRNFKEVDSTLVQQIDFAPTLVEFCGGNPPDGWQGENIFDEDFHNDYALSQWEGIYSIR